MAPGLKAAWSRRLESLWPRVAGAWFVVLLPLLILGSLSEEIWEGESFRFDAHALLWLHAHAHSWLDVVMLWVSRVGGTGVIIASILWFLALLRAKRIRAALFVVLCMSGVGLLNFGAKLVFGRFRPDLWTSLSPQADYSFPSGHAMMSSAFVAMTLVFVWRRSESLGVRSGFAAMGAMFVAAVGISRLYLGVHFPTDILAGWSASIAWVSLIRMFLPKT